MIKSVRDELDKQRFHKSLEAIWSVVNEANVYIDNFAPWTLKKEGNIERMNTVLFVLTETIRCLGLAVQPFMPDSSAKLLDQLKIEEKARCFASLNADSAIKPGTAIDQPQGVFPRIMEEGAAVKAAGA